MQGESHHLQTLTPKLEKTPQVGGTPNSKKEQQINEGRDEAYIHIYNEAKL
jgi:hypothetical protein